MKTQEEIVIQAKEYAESIGNEDGTSAFDYMVGYNNCQEDMAKKLEMHILLNEHDWSRNPQAQLRDFINSLNKQD
jgi:hypothetical protein